MWELLAFAVLSGTAAASAKQLKNSVKPPKKKGQAKPVSDFKRRKAAQKKRK